MEFSRPIPHYWTAARRFWFRFFCCFFILYTFPFPLTSPPFVAGMKSLQWYFDLFDNIDTFWHWLVKGTGKHVLHLKAPITTFTNGSGDTTYDYVLMLTEVVLSLFIAIIWTIIDRSRRSYNTAYYWLCVLIRYFLASMMLSYGFAKVFHLQMPYPYLSRLLQPYGDSSPMGLAWTYVGQSKAFSVFVGWSEVVCGLLLLFRKTSLVGSLLSLVVMGNVVAINLCYDVPVKLFSSTLELMALYLAAPFLPSLYTLFIKHKPGVLVKQERPVFRKRWMGILINILKLLFIASAIFRGIAGSLDSTVQYGDDRPKPALYGIYNAETVICNHDTLAPLSTDTIRWKQLVIQAADFAKVKMMNDTVYNYNFRIDTIKHTAVVFPVADTLHKSNFSYVKDSVYLTLTGKVKEGSIYMRFKRYDEKKFRLMARGFHWINETPYNK